MNGRRFLLNCFVVLLGSLALRAAGGAVLPATVRQTTNGASVRPQIAPLVEKLAAALKSDDPEARGQLIDEVLPGGTNPATPSVPFLDVYADVVNTELLKLANDPNPRVRLNVAIVAARVAEQSKNARLIPTIVDLLEDPNEAVVSWALKGTKGVFIPAHTPAAGVQGTKVVPAFVAAAKKYVTSGPMTQTAYESLRVVEAANTPAAAIKAAIDAAHEVLGARRDLYVKGLPEYPSSERTAVSFLALDKIWKAQGPAQQLTTIQLISDMTGLVAQHFATAGTIVRGELAGMLKTNGGALIIIGISTNTSTKMDIFAKPLSQAAAANAPETISDRAKATYDGLTNINAWKDLKPAPTIQK